jgi:hypothetical protein
MSIGRIKFGHDRLRVNGVLADQPVAVAVRGWPPGLAGDTDREMTERLHRIARAAFACVAALAAACANDVRSSHVTTDSAGVRIVESHRPAWASGTGWRVSEQPIADIAGTDDNGETVLDRITGVIGLDDGDVIVASMGDNTIRRYARDGRLIWRAGGYGSGTGQFVALAMIRQHGGELVASGYEPDDIDVFDLDGRHVRSLDPPPGLPPGGGVAAIAGDGSIIYGESPVGFPPKAAEWGDSTTLVRASPAGGIDTIGRMLAVRFVDLGRSIGYRTFAPFIRIATGSNIVYASFPEAWEIDARDFDGALRHRIRRSWTPEPVTAEQIDSVRRAFVTPPPGAIVPPRIMDMRREQAAQLRFAEHHPAFARMLVDALDNLWVERYVLHPAPAGETRLVTHPQPTRWDVFDASGVWLGTIDLPAYFVATDIGADRVSGVWADEAGIEHARVYGLARQ